MSAGRGRVPDDLMVDRWPRPGAASGPRSSGRRRRRRPGYRAADWALLLLLAGAGLCALYFGQSLTAPFNSDGAANVLQGQAIVTGNPLLRGWWTSDVSFYTTELPEYALVTAIRGLSPDVVHLCGALTYTLTVLLTALVARGGGRAGAGRSPRGLVPGRARGRDHARAQHHRRHRGLPGEPGPRGHRGPRPARCSCCRGRAAWRAVTWSAPGRPASCAAC